MSFTLKGVFAVPGKNEYASLADMEMAKKLASLQPYSLYWDSPDLRGAYQALYGAEATERLRGENLAVVHQQKERAVPEALWVAPDPVVPTETVYIGAPPTTMERKILTFSVSEFKQLLKDTLREALKEL
jgi:hypothetical protein